MLKINKTIVCAPIHFSDRSKDVPFCLELEPFSTNVLWWYSQSSEEDRELMRDFLNGNEIVREGCSVTFIVADDVCRDSEEDLLDFLVFTNKQFRVAQTVNSSKIQAKIIWKSMKVARRFTGCSKLHGKYRMICLEFSVKFRYDVPGGIPSCGSGQGQFYWLDQAPTSLGYYDRLRVIKMIVSKDGVYCGSGKFLAPVPKTNSARFEIFKAEMKLEKDLVNFASLLKLGSDFAADAGDRLALSSGLANFKFKYRGPMTYIFMLFGQDSAPIGRGAASIGRGPNLSTTEVNVCLPQLTEGPHSIVHGMREVANYCTRSIDQWIASGVMKHMSIESGGTRVAVRTAVQYGVMAGKTFDEVVEFLRNLCAFLNAYANFLESIMGAVRNHSRSDSTIVRNLCGLIAQAMQVSPADYLDYEVEPIRKLAYWYVMGAV